METYTEEREEDNSYTEAWSQPNLWENQDGYYLSLMTPNYLPVLLTAVIHNASKYLQYLLNPNLNVYNQHH